MSVPSSRELVKRMKGICVWSVARHQLDRLALWRATTDRFEYGRVIGSDEGPT